MTYTRSRAKMGGRPRKIPRSRGNAGRKPAVIHEASSSTIRSRAVELSNNERYNKIDVLEIALKIIKRRLNNDTYYKESMAVDESSDKDNKNKSLCVVEEHSNESALALCLELKLSRSSYEILLKDTKNRGCQIFRCWSSLGLAKGECRPKDYNISEVLFLLIY